MIGRMCFAIVCSVLAAGMNAQVSPDVTTWIQNTTATGYGGILSNVQQVQYSANNVYVSCTCIPGYSIGPWVSNPNVPSNQNFVYKITRTPVQNTSTPISTPLGHTGVWSNGVSIFNAEDGMSYNNLGVWNRNAYYYEGVSFDNCLGHPAPNGEYHHHVNPLCLYNDLDSANHSPVIGYAFDGFPVYGAYAYTNTNGTGPIKRMISSYVLSTATTRTNGPAVSTTYPAGCFCEDYIYTAGSGDLDAHNGRFCITPEYPSGTYAYFVTIDQNQTPVYPFVIGNTYYGTVPAGNTGPSGGHNTITETVTTYTTGAGIEEKTAKLDLLIYPNPSSDYVFVYMQPTNSNNFVLSMTDAEGRTVYTQTNIQPTISYTIDVTTYAKGIYLLSLKNGEKEYTQKVVVK
jgi:hypothetical protein